MKTLILYYSQAVGNTEKIANLAQKELNADMEKIDTIHPYTGTYEEITEQGRTEVEHNYKPPIKPINSDISRYDRIGIFFPTWWYEPAPAISTLLSKIDLIGKDVIIVQTHAGWPGHAIEDAEKMCKGANIISTYQIQFDSSGGSDLITPIENIKEWLKKLKV